MTTVVIGPWLIDVQARTVVAGDVARSLTPKAAEVLGHLVQHRNQVVSSDELLDLFWRGALSADNAVQKAVSELRRALDDDPRNPRYIETISKRGYRLKLPDEGEVKDAEPEKAILAALQAQALLKSPTKVHITSTIGLLEDAFAKWPQSSAVVCELVEAFVLMSDTGEPWWDYATMAESAVAGLSGDAAAVHVARGTLAQKEYRELEALDHYRRAVEVEPGHHRALCKLMRLLSILGRADEARALVDPVFSADSLSPMGNLLIAEALSNSGESEDADAYLERAVSLGPKDPGVLVRAGRFRFWRQGDYPQALQLFLQAHFADRQDVRAPSQIMAVMLELEQDQARAHWLNVVREINVHAQSLAFWHVPGVARPYDERRAYVDHFRALQPKELDWLRVSAEIELDLADQFERSGQNDARNAALAKAIELFASFLAQRGDVVFDERGAPVRTILRDQDTYATLRYVQANECLNNDEIVKQVMRQSVSFIEGSTHGPVTPIDHIQLFIAYTKLNEIDEAVKHLQKASELGFVPLRFLDLSGITKDDGELWHGVNKHPVFHEVYKRQTVRIQRALKQLRTDLPPLFVSETLHAIN